MMAEFRSDLTIECLGHNEQYNQTLLILHDNALKSSHSQQEESNPDRRRCWCRIWRRVCGPFTSCELVLSERGVSEE